MLQGRNWLWEGTPRCVAAGGTGRLSLGASDSSCGPGRGGSLCGGACLCGRRVPACVLQRSEHRELGCPAAPLLQTPPTG